MPVEIHRFQITPVVGTGGAYTANALLFATTEVTTKIAERSRTGRITSIHVDDDIDQKAAFNIIFLSSNVSAGTVDRSTAPTISDANSLYTLGTLQIAASDYMDVGGNSQVSIKNLNIPVTGVEGLYAYGQAVGTPTYTAATNLKITAFIEVDV